MPGSVAELNVTDLGEPKAFPLSSGRQAALALAGKLVSQHDLLPFGVAQDDRAKLAGVSIVQAKDLSPACHCFGEQVIGRAWHGISDLSNH